MEKLSLITPTHLPSLVQKGLKKIAIILNLNMQDVEFAYC
jgi:hypothetical protein